MLVCAFILVAVFVFIDIFSGKIILPQFLNVLGFKIYFYGLILALSVLAGYYFSRRRLDSINLSIADFDNIVLIIVINGFIGARLYHVFSSFGYYSQHWSEIFYVWNGGLSIFGAILGALVGVYAYQRYYLNSSGNSGDGGSGSASISFLKLLDFLVPSVVLGQAIGRFGNLFNYEIYGPPTNVLWKMFVPLNFRIPPFETFQFFHPLFLYESLACLLILLILVKWLDIAKYLRITPQVGQVFFIWLGLYNIERLVTEFMRIDSPYLFGFKQNYITAGVLVVVTAYFFIRTIIKSRNESHSS